jgi:hypothetical protein
MGPDQPASRSRRAADDLRDGIPRKIISGPADLEDGKILTKCRCLRRASLRDAP